jgi:hypothetical protein
MKIGALVTMLVAMLMFVLISMPTAAEARGCPSGTYQYGNRCVSCPSGATYVGGGKCQRTTRTYKCPSGCTYAGGGKCRCRRYR